MPQIHKPATRVECLARYYDITDELNGLYAELATVQQAELQSKSNTWVSYMQNTVTERDRYSTHAALEYTSEIMGIRSFIDSLMAERQYLDRMLTYAD
jgi:hypothetical protein